jgi:hypothetical protein
MTERNSKLDFSWGFVAFCMYQVVLSMGMLLAVAVMGIFIDACDK